MSDSGWYYDDRGERRGPVHFSILRRMGEIGTIHGGTRVWNETLDGWEPAARHIPGIAPPPLNASRSGSVGRGAGYRDYHERVGMGAAVSRAFSGYFDFSGRSNRGEYWWFVLANILIGAVTGVADAMVNPFSDGPGVINGLWTLVVLIPGIALTARRLHDTGRSGWYQILPLAGFIPLALGVIADVPALMILSIVGYLGLGILLLVWLCQRGDSQPNRFG